jgi:hypothetical protein
MATPGQLQMLLVIPGGRKDDIGACRCVMCRGTGRVRFINPRTSVLSWVACPHAFGRHDGLNLVMDHARRLGLVWPRPRGAA